KIHQGCSRFSKPLEVSCVASVVFLCHQTQPTCVSTVSVPKSISPKAYRRVSKSSIALSVAATCSHPRRGSKLLSFCIKRLKNLSKVKLTNAEFVWTEPHSKRIKVKLTVQAEVLNGAVLEQSYPVEYTVRDNLCESCSRFQTNPDQWVASVQLRQHVSHRRSFFYLEQLILRHDAASRAVRIKQVHQGIDFFFGNKSHADSFVDFLSKVVPIEYRQDKQLVYHDVKSSLYNYKCK
ncbi:unnamed protein product, partial [Brassica oleracea var. botrytis]